MATLTFDQDENTLQLARGARSRGQRAAIPRRARKRLRAGPVSVLVNRRTLGRLTPLDREIRLRLPLTFERALAGRRLAVEVAASDDLASGRPSPRRRDPGTSALTRATAARFRLDRDHSPALPREDGRLGRRPRRVAGARGRPAARRAERRPDHRRHAARGPRLRQPGADAQHRRADAPGAELHALLPRGDAHDPRPAVDPQRPARFPVPRLAPLQGPPARARLGAARGREQGVHERAAAARLLDRVRDRQHRRRLLAPLEALPQQRPQLRQDGRAVRRNRQGRLRARAAPLAAARRWRTPRPATGSGATSPTGATPTTRRSRSRRACSATPRACSRRPSARRPFAMVVDTFEPHEPWTPPRKYVDMYGNPDYHGPEPARPYYAPVSRYLSAGEARVLLARMRALYAAEVTMTDRWLGHVPRQARRAEPRAGDGGDARLRPRLLPRRPRAAPGRSPPACTRS